MGKYYPKEPTAVGYKSRATKFGYENNYSMHAREKKADLEFNQASLCKHLAKNMAHGMIEHVPDTR